SRRRHTRSYGDWSSDVCSSDLLHHSVVRRLELLPLELVGVTRRRLEVHSRQLRLVRQIGVTEVRPRQCRRIEAPVELPGWVERRSEERRVGKGWRAGEGGGRGT